MRKVPLLSALFFCGVILLGACKKTGELEPSFSQNDLNAAFTDTISVRTVTLRDDTARTDETARALFGVYNDPIFGVTQTSFYSEFHLTTTELEFPSGTIVDSAVLVLAYDGSYGMESQQMKMQVFELTAPMDPETDYYNYSSIDVGATPVATKDFIPNLSDTALADTTLEPNLRVLLNNDLVDRLNQRIASGQSFEEGDDGTSANDLFREFLKGYYVAPDPTFVPASGEGSILYFNLLSSTSRLKLYYHFDDGSQQSAIYELAVSNATARFNHFEHDYSGTEVENALAGTIVEKSYVQPLSGVKTKIEFPFVTNFSADRLISINKAELEITLSEGLDLDNFPAAERLILISLDEEGKDIFIPDFFEGTDYFGGNFDINTNTYTFNIARYLDQIMNQKADDKGLFLIVSGSVINANRLVVNSGKHPTARMKLNLTYTEL